MKLKNLFEKEVLQEAEEKNLIGLKINGKVIDENTPNEKWTGHFDCSNKGLTSLEGSPLVVDGVFSCSMNLLVSLKGSPREVGGFSCTANNQLTTLEGGPTKVNGVFLCGFNRKLTSLEGAPEFVGSNFECGGNDLVSLKGAPRYVGGDFSCNNSGLKSLEGAPSEIGSYFSCKHNHLASLHNIHKHIKKMNGTFYATSNPIKSHVLGLMLIDGITDVKLDNKEVENILNSGIKNKKHWTEVQAELEEAGFEEYAQL